ncbi:hypothetical protein [Kribbella sp. CA-293567]|uniref:hypothetical protein n=1 Tax=Kribbella sp. CA-293567 TaxID=3002436 RepID=UPI0022DCF691|nr:hypothetical protein [Kribbella sp. CA-293567]WBQ03497.1 hypothetical protein OX958_26420 [Kribbella sp. CA-293567]
MTVGGVDTYYDYDEKQWKSRRLGGGPIQREPVVPTLNSRAHDEPDQVASHGRTVRPRKNDRASA